MSSSKHYAISYKVLKDVAKWKKNMSSVSCSPSQGRVAVLGRAFQLREVLRFRRYLGEVPVLGGVGGVAKKGFPGVSVSTPDTWL